MGILDSKKRFIDTIVTEEGRRQMAQGKMHVRYVTFTDADAYYEFDAISGSSDASERFHFEAFSRPQDVITFESDDVGALMQFPNAQGGIIAGHVLVASGSNFLSHPSSSFQRRAAQHDLLSSSFDSFRQQYIIGSHDPLTDDRLFSLDQRTVRFERLNITKSVNIDDAPSFFQDRRLTHAVNFTYLPPIAHVNGKTVEVGRYSRLDQGDSYTLTELRRHLHGKQHNVVRFVDTSTSNNVFGQFFELNDIITKLDVIDFGEFDENGVSLHVFFVGKLRVDSRGSHTFLNIFTLLFS
jgi:hypothetical protein